MRLSLLGTSFTAWIKVDGVESDIFKPEYSIDEAGHPVASCWIESTVGKTFGVFWRDSTRAIYTSTKVSFDGVTYPGRYHIPSSRIQGRGMTVSCTSARDTPTTRRKLVFGVLELSDDDALLNQHDASHIGEIKIEIRHVVQRDTKSSRAGPDHDTELNQPKKIHETSKKAGSHQIKLGQVIEERRARRSTGPGKRYQVVAHVGTLIFRYRSRDLLIADGIMPRPDPVTRPSVAPPNDITDEAEEIRRLEERLKELHERRKVKQELDPSRIKQETRNVRLGPGGSEVIDLTLD